MRELSPATRTRGHETKSNVCLTFIKVRDSGKSIFEVLEWYNDIINFFIDYISLSIHDSDISEFYRYIIGFKNLLRCLHDDVTYCYQFCHFLMMNHVKVRDLYASHRQSVFLFHKQSSPSG